MPVTTRAASVAVKPVEGEITQLSPTDILQRSCPAQHKECGGLLATSFGESEEIQCSGNGFVNCALDAYLQHNHLVIRPDDVWFAILTQFNFYVNAHAEELRDFFAPHNGRKKLKIVQQDQMDIKEFALGMTHLIAENIKDPTLREWIMPSFTTTIPTDKGVASIIMMGTMQRYFAYFLDITCGIPSVTLLGEKTDWEEILHRLEFLNTFKGHEELLLWYSVLKPIVSRFVRTFDAPDSPEIVSFWQRTVHQHIDHYVGDKHITGWILAFCFWNTEGAPLIARQMGWESGWKKRVEAKGPDFWLEEDKYGELEWNNVPAGFSHMPVHIRFKGGSKFVAVIVAGSVGWKLLDSDDVFPTTRRASRLWKPENNSQTELKLERPSSGNKTSNAAGALRKALRRLICLRPEPAEPAGEKIAPSLESSSTEFDDWDKGSKRDTLQPVSGWWAIIKKNAVYGNDGDCPDTQFDSEAEDYDRDLAENARPLSNAEDATRASSSAPPPVPPSLTSVSMASPQLGSEDDTSC